MIYRQRLVALLFIFLLVNVLYANLLQPDLRPMDYVPLINFLDMWQIIVVVSIAYWWRMSPEQIIKIIPTNLGWSIIAGVAFLYLNTLLLRCLHVATGIPFNGHSLFSSDLVQTCLSIFWTLLGIGLFIAANRFIKRKFWLLGMTLFGVVVVKLFIIDLANSGSVERIVSFIAVGLLLLAVGYLVPIPDKEESYEASTQ